MVDLYNIVILIVILGSLFGFLCWLIYKASTSKSFNKPLQENSESFLEENDEDPKKSHLPTHQIKIVIEPEDEDDVFVESML